MTTQLTTFAIYTCNISGGLWMPQMTNLASQLRLLRLGRLIVDIITLDSKHSIESP